MPTSKKIMAAGALFLLLGILAVAFSQTLIEEVLEVEREFGEEPLSLSFVRGGLFIATMGAALLFYGARKSLKARG